MIEKLNSENFLLRSKLTTRAINSKLSFPLFTIEDRKRRNDTDFGYRNTLTKGFRSPSLGNNHVMLHKKQLECIQPTVTTVQSTHQSSKKFHSDRPMTSNGIGFYQITH